MGDSAGEMIRVGMRVHLSHVSADVMNDTLDPTEAPVVFSQCPTRALTHQPRNVPGDGAPAQLIDGGGA